MSLTLCENAGMEQSSDLFKHAGRQARSCSLTGTGHQRHLRRTHEHGCTVMHSGVSSSGPTFWAKTVRNEEGEEVPGLSVFDHCLNVGCVAEALIAALPSAVRALLPVGAATLAALHDAGKITLGFQAKCSRWLHQHGLPKFSPAEVVLSVTDHALISQYFLQGNLLPGPARLWAVAVGAHHGRPKGRSVRVTPLEALADWARAHRAQLAADLLARFGDLPSSPPDPRFEERFSDLWLLAGLITVADWIGSNETWFPPDHGLSLTAARRRAHHALAQIGWPGGTLKTTGFSEAFAPDHLGHFEPNALQKTAAELGRTAEMLIVEGPMGCGKTEAALYAALQRIAAGLNHGMYFALPTQVTSNRIHRRIGNFLRRTLEGEAPLRLAHGNAWLEDDFDLRLRPAFGGQVEKDEDSPAESVREARTWFATAKQALLATYGVGTIDQALQGVVAVKHFFVRRFALAGKVVILDEIHSYDLYTGTLITTLVRELLSLRCSVIILSATLTAARRQELLQAIGASETQAPAAYPLVTSSGAGRCHHLAPAWPHRRRVILRPGVITPDETVAEMIRRAETGQHVLWIRNTVVEAQDAFRWVSGSVKEGTVGVGLLHSRFPFQRRAELEEAWLERLGKDRPSNGPGTILIATQVVEQSVDIDLDFIVSDLAPTDMLLQRLGRLWRHERHCRHATAPEFWVRFPELPPAARADALRQSLGRSARVYAPYVLVRTLEVWRTRREIDLPANIRPLLEATYAEPNQDEPEAWRQLHTELEKTKRELALNAEAATRVLGNPMLTDREEVLTRRKGPPTTPVVLLRSLTGGRQGLTALVALDGTRLEISEHEWRRAHARFLLQWTVRAPRWMVPADAPRPRWLGLYGPSDAVVAVVRDDGRCCFGDEISPMTYDPRAGVFAERAARPTPQTWKDDDDEFDC